MATKPKPAPVTPAAKPAPKPPAKKPATTAVAVKPAGQYAVGDVIDHAEILKQAALKGRQEVAKAPSSTSAALSFRNGTISYQGREIGHEMKIIMIHPQFQRVYYPDAFDPDKITPPDCYSFDGVKPHVKSSDPQNPTCKGCRWDEFGSDARGRGKACREGLRMALLPGDKIEADYLAASPMIMATFSVLNSKIARSYTEMLYETAGHPARVVTLLKCNPDPKVQLVNDFEALDEITGDGVMSAIATRVAEAEAFLTQPYPEMDPADRPSPGRKAGNKKIRRF